MNRFSNGISLILVVIAAIACGGVAIKRLKLADQERQRQRDREALLLNASAQIARMITSAMVANERGETTKEKIVRDATAAAAVFSTTNEPRVDNQEAVCGFWFVDKWYATSAVPSIVGYSSPIGPLQSQIIFVVQSGRCDAVVVKRTLSDLASSNPADLFYIKSRRHLLHEAGIRVTN